MESPTLGNIFTKHLGFPSRRGGALGAESFADRFADRHHAFTPQSTDPESWVEHFFELEHPIEERVRELESVGAASVEGDEAVLQFDLSENEFVVIDDGGEDVVVVGDRGSIVLQATPDLRTRLKAAELPSTSVRPSSAFKGSGDRAFHVSGSGRTVQLDAKAVARVVASTPAVRAEPTARVVAPRQLATHAPVVRTVAVPVPVQVRGAPSAKAPTQAFDTVRTVARGDRGLTPSPQVVVVERSSARAVSGESARFWQRLTSAVTAGGRRSENLGRTLPGVSAVAIGRQTFAVKAGGVTALVQRPVQGMGTRAEAMAARTNALERRTSSSSRWVRDVLSERPRGQGFWIPPAVATGTVGAAKPSWVESALGHARDLRQRARDEIRSPDRVAVTPARRVVPGEAPEIELALPEVRFRAVPVDMDVDAALGSARPLISADVMPATTLRALYTGLERTAAGEGHRIAATPATRLDTITSGTTEAFVDVRYGAPTLRTQVHDYEATPETSYVAPAYYDAPFAEGSAVRVGPELTAAIDRAVLRPIASTRATPTPTALAAAPVSTVSPTTRAREEARSGIIDVQVVSGRTTGPTATTMPAAVSGLMGASSAPMRLSATAWLDWAVSNAPYALAKGAGEAIARPVDDTVSKPNRTGLPDPLKSGVENLSGFALDKPAPLQAHAYAEGTDIFVAPGQAQPIAHEAAHVVQQSQGRVQPTAQMTKTAAGVPASPLEREADGTGRRVLSTPSAGLAIAHAGPASPVASPTVRGTFGAPARPLTTSGEKAIVVRPVLADVNHARAPAHATHDAHAEDGGVEHVEIGVPLHVTMTESRRAPEAGHALAEGAPASVTLVPHVSGTHTVDVGGHAVAATSVRGPSPTRSQSIARPGGDFALNTPPVAGQPASRGAVSMGTVDSEIVFGARGPREGAIPVEGREFVATGKAPAPVSHGAAPASASASSARSLGIGPASARGATPTAEASPGTGVRGSVGVGPTRVPATTAVTGSGARRKARGEGILRFKYPAEPRWWGAGTTTVDVSGSGASSSLAVPGVRAAAHGAAPAAVHVESGVMTAAPASVSVGAAASNGRSVHGAPSMMASPASYGSRGARVNGPLSTEGSAPPMVHAAPAAAESHGPREGEMAYVAVSANGEARVMGARSAAQLAKHKKSGGSVDMTVVAGIAPKAPSMEELALAGHERPHAKGKKEGPAQGGAAGKTDALSLQGTVDSLAQRIYHRLKRRLASDRERFGG